MVTKIQCGGRERNLAVVESHSFLDCRSWKEIYDDYVQDKGPLPSKPANLSPITVVLDDSGSLIGCSGEYGGECVRNNEPPAKLRHAPCPFVR